MSVEILSETDGHCHSFGYEWTKYSSGHYLDKVWTYNKCKLYLEYFLGFPLTLLRHSRVLEVGSGTGRFSQVLAEHCKELTSVELSQAVFINKAADKPNVKLVKADFYDLPYGHSYDVVLCMGVLQHTDDPAKHLIRLFDYALPSGIVAFNVYAARPRRSWKYFGRDLFPKYFSVEEFDDLLDKNIDLVFELVTGTGPRSAGRTRSDQIKLLHDVLDHYKHNEPYQDKLNELIGLIQLKPLFSFLDWQSVYPNATDAELKEVIKCDLIDGIYARYDSPMSMQNVLDTLANINQYPYSYTTHRNIFRCQLDMDRSINKITVTKKHGIEIS